MLSVWSRPLFHILSLSVMERFSSTAVWRLVRCSFRLRDSMILNYGAAKPTASTSLYLTSFNHVAPHQSCLTVFMHWLYWFKYFKRYPEQMVFYNRWVRVRVVWGSASVRRWRRMPWTRLSVTAPRRPSPASMMRTGALQLVLLFFPLTLLLSSPSNPFVFPSRP